VTATHQVTNQPPPLVDYEVSADAALREGLSREGAEWYLPELESLGRRAGTAESQRWGVEANEHEPVLRTHDRFGNRVDEVEFHPAWHSLMTVAVGAGLAGAPWASTTPGAQVARAAGFYTWSQVEGGHGCPISMTCAVIPALRMQPDLAAAYEPLLTSRTYDPGLRVPSTKTGLLAGMGMTEKQGGSDVRANTTTAAPAGDGTFRLTGHKWFTSAPMCDLFLVLAQAPGGLSCFLVPRVLPDGERNTFRIQRLKDKLGNRSNASSEPEFDNTVAWLVGEEGRGVRTIIEMVSMTRLDCVIGSATLMRQALVQAIHHSAHRSAFGGLLIDKPLMQNVLADLAVESEAATTLMMRLAGAVDRAQGGDRQEAAFKRLAVAVGKYWITKRAPNVAAEALECLGGNGYVEESGMPRLYREAPLNSVWEGSGNVNALDVLRAMAREPECVEAFFGEVSLADDARITSAVSDLQKDLGEADELSARRLVERLALVLQGSLLIRHAPAGVADAFCATRLGHDWGSAFGTLPRGFDLRAILDRAAPVSG
jgi:putative acyl-CoA dehydrogenase